jgi:hypothetical protein
MEEKAPLTEKEIFKDFQKIFTAFPFGTSEFYGIMVERIAAQQIYKEELQFTINHILDNYDQKHLTIAYVVQLLQKIKSTSRGFKSIDLNRIVVKL